MKGGGITAPQTPLLVKNCVDDLTWGGNKEVQEIEPIRVAARMPA
jgi:hypothetical protein